MTMKEIVEQMFDRPVRLESMWPFPVNDAPEGLIDALENYEKLPKALQPLLKNWRGEEVEHLYNGLSSNFQMAFDELCADAYRKGMFGFIGVAATPVMTPTGANSSSFSWGHYHTGFLFAETADKLLTAAIEWADKQHEQDKKRPRAKGGAA